MKLTHLLLALCITGLFSTCETEIDITADYERIPVVYGLLDPSMEKQIFMINRTFLGNVNALEVVANEDSMLYDNVDAQLEWYNTSGDLVGSAQLQEDLVEDKDVNGLFYAPTAVVYSVNSTEIWDNWPDQNDNAYVDYTYKLNVIADGEMISSETRMASTYGTGFGVIQQPVNNDNIPLNLVNTFSPNGSTYNGNVTVEWNPNTQNAVENAVKQQMIVRFNYTEHYTNGETKEKTISFPYVTKDVDFAGQRVLESKSGELFYSRIGSALGAEETPDNLRYRAIGTFDFVLSVAGQDLTNYLNLGVNQVSEVGQSTPSFSNINDGDGIGIFSSRDVLVRSKRLYVLGGEAELKEMVDGQYTAGNCFCDPTGESSEYDCANSANWCQ